MARVLQWEPGRFHCELHDDAVLGGEGESKGGDPSRVRNKEKQRSLKRTLREYLCIYRALELGMPPVRSGSKLRRSSIRAATANGLELSALWR
jgi:hypothetical protein